MSMTPSQFIPVLLGIAACGWVAGYCFSAKAGALGISFGNISAAIAVQFATICWLMLR